MALLRRFVVSPLGEWRHGEFASGPLLPSREAADEALADIREAMDLLREAERPRSGRTAGPELRFGGLRDVRTAVARLHVENAALEAADLYDLLEVLDRSQELKRKLETGLADRPRLAAKAELIGDFHAVLRELSGKILPKGELADNASPALNRIRRQIEQQRVEVERSLDRFVKKLSAEGILQDEYVTIRNGRLVVPVKTGWKRRVEGVIHSASGTGQTVFVEPLETIENNNRLVKLLEEEQREIFQILLEMTGVLRPRAAEVEMAVGLIADLDLLFAKAHFGREFRCAIPVFADGGAARFSLRGARHPLLEDVLRPKGARPVALTLTLDAERRVVVISGPNAGGKTVVLKTAGLLALMARSGLPVPADEAEIPWFDEVLADIGDAQSITESLSTFSAHLTQIRSMMDRATGASLVLLDELGAATDPQEGGALGIALIDYFLERGAMMIVSTHLPAIKVYGANAPRVTNAAVGFDVETLSPTYRLSVGLPGQSAGLAIAARLGLPETILERARGALESQEEEAAVYLERLRMQLAEIEESRQAVLREERRWKELQRELERESKQQLEKRVAEMERRVAKEVARFEAQGREILEKLAEADVATPRSERIAERKISSIGRELKQEVAAAAAVARGLVAQPAAIADVAPVEGASVRLRTMKMTGQITRRLGDDLWEVQVGQLKVKAGGDDFSEVIAPDQSAKAPAALPSRVSFQGAVQSVAALSEINLIGRTADEARDEVDKLLDNAVLAEVGRIRVIHGHGMHVLRRALWQMFATHPHVAKYYQAEQTEGGAGATIVEVRLEEGA
jgi:DNA mismatch repair protein MutS2